MKKIVLKSMGLACVLAMAALSGCNLFEEAGDVSFDTTLKGSAEVRDGVTGINRTYAQTITLDATADSEIQEYESKIKNFRVKEVRFIISTFTGSTSTSSTGQMGFSAINANAATVAATANVADLGTASTAATKYKVELNDVGIATLGTTLRDDKALKIYLNGTVSKTPARFMVNVEIDVTVYANALQ